MTDDSSIAFQGIYSKTAFETFTDILLDLQLCGPHGVVPITANATLRYLSAISISCVPLCLIAGAPFEVYSNNATTCEWLLEILAREPTETVQNPEPWWDHPSTQSHLGYLLGIEDNETKDTGDQTRLTELLLYATTAEQDGNEAALPSPPPSSPRAIDGPEDPGQGNIHLAPPILFRALPICSNLPRIAGQSAGLLNADQRPQTTFINLEPPLAETGCKHGKRRALTTVFHEASQERKKLKGRGGEAVGRFVKEPETDKLRSTPWNENTARTSSNIGGDGSAGRTSRPTSSRRSRSSTIIPDVTGGSSALDKNLPIQGNSYQDVPKSQDTAILDINKNSEQVEQQNKALLSRTVMAGMRLHGLQQPRKSIQRTASLPAPIPAAPSSDDTANEEYRQMYHHTYKAAAFALRHQMCTQILKGDDLRETVDRLLGIFLPGTAAVEDHAGDSREGF